jgi:hypothetical protein
MAECFRLCVIPNVVDSGAPLGDSTAAAIEMRDGNGVVVLTLTRRGLDDEYVQVFESQIVVQETQVKIGRLRVNQRFAGKIRA